MGPTFLLDEHLRGLLWRAIRSHNARSEFHIDATRVGDPPDLPLGSEDASIIEWAARQNRILVAQDKRTLPDHLARRLAAGGRSPGILLVRSVPLPAVVEFLACAAHASDASEWQDQIRFVP